MIRRYRAEDEAGVLAVWSAASAVGHPFLSDDFLAKERLAIARVHLPSAETWVWESEGRIVGFISLLESEVGAVFVDPESHGVGIGRALVEYARGLRGDLEVEVFEQNVSARAFYARCGFFLKGRSIHDETGLEVLRLETRSTP